MDDREALTELRSLVVRGDHAGLVATLSQARWPVDSLQLIGDGLLAAVREGTEGSAALAEECVNALRERRWAGDQELAEVLDAALANGPTPMLRPLLVDLEELSMVLEGDPVQGGGRIDLRTGEVWPQSAIEYAEEVGEIDEIDDPPFAYRLACAISGRGAFRRFKDVLSDRPELMTRWFALSNDRQRGRARSWLATEGYVPTRP